MSNDTSSNDIRKSFDTTIRKSELSGVSMDLAELGFDSMLAEGILKELPIIKVAYSLIKEGINIHDRLFMKKLVSFLIRINDIEPRKRQQMIDAIDSSKKYRIQVGEKLLYILDACKDYEASELVGELFKAYLKSNISYDEYLLAAETLSSTPVSDIREFINDYDAESKGRAIDEVSEYVHNGLYNISFEPPQVSVRQNDDWKQIRDGGSEYIADVDGGDIWAMPSEAVTLPIY